MYNFSNYSPSVQESFPSLDSFKSGFRIAQTQTEKKISFLQQFRYCFMGNERYRQRISVPTSQSPQQFVTRKDREKKAVLAGVSFNSVSRIDSFDRYSQVVNYNCETSYFRLLFPLSFLVFNLIYWTIYFKTAKHFSWGDHAVLGNIGE